MSSINTNLSAMTALQALKTTQNALNKTQNQISTGLRVGEASHNASYWSIATAMKSDNGALGAVKDAIKQSIAMIDTYTSAMDKTLASLNKMKEGMIAANQPDADRHKIQTEFDAHIAGMKNIAASAQFNGQNWLAGTGGIVDIVTSYDGVNNKVGTLGIDTTETTLFRNPATGAGGILAEVAAIHIPSIAPNSSGTELMPTTKWVRDAAHIAGFNVSLGDFAPGATISWTSATGAVVNHVFGVGENATNATLEGVIAGLQAGGVNVVFDGTSLSIQGSDILDDSVASTVTFRAAGAPFDEPKSVNSVGHFEPDQPGKVIFSPSEVEILEGNYIRWRVDGGEEKIYKMVEGETGPSLAQAIQDQFGSEVTASWDDTIGLTIAAAVLTSSATGTFVSGEMEQTLKNIDQAIDNVTKGSAMLGANKALLETQESFIGVLSDSLTAGVSAFVDADMNEASTRNQALQTQQQLGVQALSMANQNSQMILKLFQ